ncbi:hypothetical protein D9M72_462060 [compost metagenome]
MRPRRFLAHAQRCGNQFKAGGPALGDFLQHHRCVDRGLRTLPAHGASFHALAHEGQRFGNAEGQLGAAGFGQLPASAQPAQGQPGLAARRGDDMQVRQARAQHALQEGQRGRVPQAVEPVQHQVDLARHAVQQRDERGQQLDGVRRVVTKLLAGPAHADAGLPQAGVEAGAELSQVVVFRREREPGHARAAGQQAVAPLRHDGGLAIAGRRSQQYQPAMPGVAQALQQDLARDRAPVLARRHEAGRDGSMYGFHGRPVRNRSGAKGRSGEATKGRRRAGVKRHALRRRACRCANIRRRLVTGHPANPSPPVPGGLRVLCASHPGHPDSWPGVAWPPRRVCQYNRHKVPPLPRIALPHPHFLRTSPAPSSLAHAPDASQSASRTP